MRKRFCIDCKTKLQTKISLLKGKCVYCRNKKIHETIRLKKWNDEHEIILGIKNNFEKNFTLKSHNTIKKYWVKYGIRYDKVSNPDKIVNMKFTSDDEKFFEDNPYKIEAVLGGITELIEVETL